MTEEAATASVMALLAPSPVSASPASPAAPPPSPALSPVLSSPPVLRGFPSCEEPYLGDDRREAVTALRRAGLTFDFVSRAVMGSDSVLGRGRTVEDVAEELKGKALEPPLPLGGEDVTGVLLAWVEAARQCLETSVASIPDSVARE